MMGLHSVQKGMPGDVPVQGGGRRWFVAHVFTGREKSAEAHLRNQQFETFSPIELRTVRHARLLVTRERAFFPGYLFVRFDADRDQWRCINGTRGVRKLFMQMERPVACPHGVVERLMEAADEHGVMGTSTALQPGQTVVVRSGPFADFVGTLERLDSAGRARVLLDIMAGVRAVRMDIQDIEAV